MLPLISLEEILAAPVTPPEWLVDSLVGLGSRVVVYGEPGSYKSWGLLDLGLHIAAGQPWLGKFDIPEARRVLYIDEEMSRSVLMRRLQRLRLGMGTPPGPGMFCVLSRYGLTCDDKGVAHFLRDLEASDFTPDVVIVETLRRVLMGDENLAKDIGAFWQAAIGQMIRLGLTVIVSHHMRKPSKGDRGTKHRASGSGDIIGGADDCLSFTRRKKDTFIVEPTKCREAPEVEPFAVSVRDPEPDGPVRLCYEGPQSTLQARTGKGGTARDLIVRYLSDGTDGTASTAEILDHLAKASPPVAKRTGEDALAAGLDEGWLERPEGSKKSSYRLANRKPQTPYKYDSGGGCVTADASQVLTRQGGTLADGLAAESPGSSGNTEPGNPAHADNDMGKAA